MYITFRRKWYIMNANKLMAWLNNKSFIYNLQEEVNKSKKKTYS